MSKRWLMAALACSFALAGSLRADLKQAQAESNLEKRSGLALDNAAARLKDARQAYDKGDTAQVAKDAAEMRDSVDLAFESLKQTGKDPRRSPKWFKRAEIETRDLARKLESFQEQMDYTDRPMLDAVKARVQQVHDDLLVGLMEGKHK
jgi:hypothetical protein